MNQIVFIDHIGGKHGMTGTIDKIVVERGWGFVKSSEDQRLYFLHKSELSGIDFRDLARGDQLEFTPAESPRGPRAAAARLVPETTADEAA